MFTLLDLCVSSLRRGHANLLCIVPILTDDPRRESKLIIVIMESPWRAGPRRPRTGRSRRARPRRVTCVHIYVYIYIYIYIYIYLRTHMKYTYIYIYNVLYTSSSVSQATTRAASPRHSASHGLRSLSGISVATTIIIIIIIIIIIVFICMCINYHLYHVYE